MFAIAGVTGNTGSVVAETLLAQKQPVRVIVRDAAKGAAWKARGAEVAVADLADRAALAKALAGATGAYLLLPPDNTTTTPLETGARLATTIADAVADAKVPHVVLLSSIGADHASGVGPVRHLHVAEDALARATALTALRPGNFMETWAGSFGGLAHGVLPTFIPVDAAYPQVATTDIGRAAARALVEGPAAGAGPRKPARVINLVGPREYSARDAAAALTAALGKPIAPVFAPLDQVVPTLTKYGMSAEVADLLREMFAGAAAGLLVPVGPVTRGTDELATVLGRLLAKSPS